MNFSKEQIDKALKTVLCEDCYKKCIKDYKEGEKLNPENLCVTCMLIVYKIQNS